MRRFTERGHEVTVLTTTTRVDGVADPPGERERGVHRALEWYWDDHVLQSPHPLRRAAMELRNQRRLRRLLDGVRPEVVSVWNVGAMSLGLLQTVAARGIPMVLAVCDEWPVHGPHLDAWGRLFAGRPRLGRVAELALRIPCRPTDLGPAGAFCFVSEHTREACRRGSDFTFPTSTVVLSGIERSDFPPGPADERPWRGRLLYVGRLDERKGVLTAVDALAELGDGSTLRFVGLGDAEHAILERAERQSVLDRVTIEARPRAELAAVYRDADVLLFTSEWDEPFGLTPIEAMACATPVIGTGTGGSAAFLVDGVTCLRCPPGDAGALAARIRRMAGDAALRRRLVGTGLQVADDLTTDRLADVFETWHEAAAAGYPAGAPADRALRLPVP
jgi:glycosyltransferase involved in cell wall biosynthesis